MPGGNEITREQVALHGSRNADTRLHTVGERIEPGSNST